MRDRERFMLALKSHLTANCKMLERSSGLSPSAYAYQLRQDQSKQSQTQNMREKQKWADQKRKTERWDVKKDPSQPWALIKIPHS